MQSIQKLRHHQKQAVGQLPEMVHDYSPHVAVFKCPDGIILQPRLKPDLLQRLPKKLVLDPFQTDSISMQ